MNMPKLATDRIFANKKIGEVTYTCTVEPLGFEMQSMLWDLMSSMHVDRRGRQGQDPQIGTVRDAVIFNAIKKLEVEDEEVALRTDYALKNLPKYMDREYMGGMADRLLEHIVEVNEWLGFEEPCNWLFRGYLPENVRDQRDPTRSDGQAPTSLQDTQNQELKGDEEVTSSSAVTSPGEPSPTPLTGPR
jgi:hypothetical protein